MEMTCDQKAIYQRLLNFSIDEIDVAYPFSKKIAYENKWDSDFTKNAIIEYKRFLFIALCADHRVTPPDIIDQVWHTHLTYTDSYWNYFCPNVLGKTLHHYPSNGGLTEDNKHNEWYTKTYNSYIYFFNQIPPQEIWPYPNQVLSSYKNHIRLDKNKYFILDKKYINITFGIILYLFYASILISAKYHYILLATSLFYASLYIKEFIDDKHPFIKMEKIQGNFLNLDCYELAYLAGGTTNVFNTAILNLYSKNYIECGSAFDIIHLKSLENHLEDDLPAIELEIINFLSLTNNNKKLSDLLSKINNSLHPSDSASYYKCINVIKKKLTAKNLLLNDSDFSIIKIYPFILTCIPSSCWILYTILFRGESIFLYMGCMLVVLYLLFLIKSSENTFFANEYIKNMKITLIKNDSIEKKEINNHLINKVAVFGISALYGYAIFLDLYNKLHEINYPEQSNSGGGGCGGGE